MKRTAGDLIAHQGDAWTEIVEWVGAAVRPVDIVEVVPARGEATLVALQVTTRSPMGAIALRSGRIVVDRGWLRILGAGSDRFGGGLREWNGLDGKPPLDPPLRDAMIVAYDAVGGFYALNGGAWEGSPGGVHYFPPDTYEWQPLELTYSALLRFVFSGDLDAFYAQLRWTGWEAEVAELGADEAISIYPPPGFGNEPLEARARRPVPARELWAFYRSVGEQVRDLPEGAAVQFHFE